MMSESIPPSPVALSWQKIVVAGMVVSGLAFQFGGTTKMLRTMRAGMTIPIEDWTTSVVVGASSSSKSNDRQSLVDAWFEGIAGEGETTCRYVQEKKQSGQWPDPNQGQIHLRLVTTVPHFFVSVHNQDYDPLRWTHILEKGTYYETEVISRFEYILGENSKKWNYNSSSMPMVVDVGGNIGYYTLLSAAWKHAVVTFEINPTNVMRLCESIHTNQPSPLAVSNLPLPMTVKIHRRGVSDATGNALTISVPNNPGATGLNNAAKNDQKNGEDDSATTHKFTVTTTTLDDFAAGHNWFDRKNDMHISLLKIDTEGHEPFILAGAKKFMKANLAKNILLEYRPECYNATLELFDAGYRLVKDSKPLQHPVMLGMADSRHYLDQETKAVKQKKTWKYADLWLRLENLPLGR